MIGLGGWGGRTQDWAWAWVLAQEPFSFGFPLALCLLEFVTRFCSVRLELTWVVTWGDLAARAEVSQRVVQRFVFFGP